MVVVGVVGGGMVVGGARAKKQIMYWAILSGLGDVEGIVCDQVMVPSLRIQITWFESVSVHTAKSEGAVLKLSHVL